MDARQQRPHVSVLVGIALEMLEPDPAVHQRAGEAVLHAELGIECALRVGPVGVGEAARVGPANRPAPPWLALSACSSTSASMASIAGMRGAAAGILLDGDARLHDVEGRRPIGEHGLRGEIAGAVEHQEEALAVLEGVVPGRETVGRQQRSHQAVARRMPDVQWLRHRAEVGLDPRSKRGGKRERSCRPSNIESQQVSGMPPLRRTCRASRSDASPSRSDGN